jgi:hypothetical protein
MFTILVRGPIKDTFFFEDKLTEWVQGQKSNGLAIELVTSDKKSSWHSQIGRSAAKAAKWWFDNV